VATLTHGTRLGAYEVLAAIGSSGPPSLAWFARFGEISSASAATRRRRDPDKARMEMQMSEGGLAMEART
jgi:hypothetical protein